MPGCHFQEIHSKATKRSSTILPKAFAEAHGSSVVRRQWPLGKNTLRCMVADICSRGGLRGYYTNHSPRRTCATQLYDNGVDEQMIKEVTGHRSDAVRESKVTTEKKQIATSDILNR
eukprot:scpid102122/ scgid3528/ 